jgi:hypothetical protein
VKGRIGPGFRGRALYPKHAQIAEALLRGYTDVMGVEAFRLIGIAEKNSGPEVIFEYPQAGTQFVINLFIEPVGQVPESCGSDKMIPLERWRGVFRESKIV